MDADATCPAHEFRRHFAERLGSLLSGKDDRPAFSGWCDADYSKFYAVQLYSNREYTVHLGVKLYVAVTGKLTQSADVLWDMAANAVGAYIEPSYIAEVRADLEAIFRGADLKCIRFSDMLDHYTMPELSVCDENVRAVISLPARAPLGPPLGPPVREVAVSFLPKNVDLTNVHHYAAMCKHGWTRILRGAPSGACAAPFSKTMVMRSTAGGRAGSGAAPNTPLLTLGFREAPERIVAYMSCFICVQCADYDAVAQTLEFMMTGTFSDTDPSTPYSDVSFAVRFCWDLRHGLVYFPDGSLEGAVNIRFAAGAAGEPFVEQCLLTRRYVFGSVLQELYGWNVPRVLWNASDSVYLASKIVCGLDWLHAFRAATRGALPDSVYHRIAMAEVPKGVRRAYEIGDVLPTAASLECVKRQRR